MLFDVLLAGDALDIPPISPLNKGPTNFISFLDLDLPIDSILFIQFPSTSTPGCRHGMDLTHGKWCLLSMSNVVSIAGVIPQIGQLRIAGVIPQIGQLWVQVTLVNLG